MKLIPLSLVIFLSAMAAEAQTLVVSDIDDTIRVTQVRNLPQAALSLRRRQNSFAGMKELYDGLVAELGAKIFYVSNSSRIGPIDAPLSHREFLRNVRFATGEVFFRGNEDRNTFKVRKIAEIIQGEQARGAVDRVILIGDNGEQDPIHYDNVRKQFPGIRFQIYIRTAYLEQSGDLDQPHRQGQGLFASPVEIVLDLERAEVLSRGEAGSTLEGIARAVSEQERDAESGNLDAPLLFPVWMNCKNLSWKWADLAEQHPKAAAIFPLIKDKCDLED